MRHSRHTYASEMLRAGVGFPALMKLIGHTDPGMTLCYLEVAVADLQREYQLARSKPRHLVPQPKTSLASVRTGLDGVIDSLVAAQHRLEMFRLAAIQTSMNWGSRINTRHSPGRGIVSTMPHAA